MKKCIALVAACCACSLSHNATADDLELRGGTLSMSTLSTASLHDALDTHRHLVVRLHKETTAPTRRTLARRGLSLLSCLGAKTWIAKVSPEANLGLFAEQLA